MKVKEIIAENRAPDWAFNLVSVTDDLPFDLAGAQGLQFGLQVPAGVTEAWGFRGIKERGGFSLLWDRQAAIGTPPAKVIDRHILPILRKHAETVDATDPRYYKFVFKLDAGTFVAVTSPRNSHGYVYGCVYREPLP